MFGSANIKLVIAAGALAAVFSTGALWHARDTRRSFEAGALAGRAAAEDEMREAAAQQARAAKTALEQARAQAAQMEERHARMQEHLEETLDAIDHDPDAADAGGVCFAAGLVRKLDAIGRESRGAARRP